MEFAFKYGIWELLRHERIPETQNLALILTVYTCLFKAKNILELSCINSLFKKLWF